MQAVSHASKVIQILPPNAMELTVSLSGSFVCIKSHSSVNPHSVSPLKSSGSRLETDTRHPHTQLHPGFEQELPLRTGEQFCRGMKATKDYTAANLYHPSPTPDLPAYFLGKRGWEKRLYSKHKQAGRHPKWRNVPKCSSLAAILRKFLRSTTEIPSE